MPVAVSTSVVDGVGGEQCDAAVAVVLVVPGHVVAHPGPGGIEIVEDTGIVRPVLHRAELRFGERVVIADPRPVVGLTDLETGQQVFEDR